MYADHFVLCTTTTHCRGTHYEDSWTWWCTSMSRQVPLTRSRGTDVLSGTTTLQIRLPNRWDGLRDRGLKSCGEWSRSFDGKEVCGRIQSQGSGIKGSSFRSKSGPTKSSRVPFLGDGLTGERTVRTTESGRRRYQWHHTGRVVEARYTHHTHRGSTGR